MSATWVEASRPPKIPLTNAHASAVSPLILMLLHLSWWTFGIVMVTICFIVVISVKGRTVTWLLRKFKSNLRGRRISARPLFYRRRVVRLQSHDALDVGVLRQEH